MGHPWGRITRPSLCLYLECVRRGPFWGTTKGHPLVGLITCPCAYAPWSAFLVTLVVHSSYLSRAPLQGASPATPFLRICLECTVCDHVWATLGAPSGHPSWGASPALLGYITWPSLRLVLERTVLRERGTLSTPPGTPNGHRQEHLAGCFPAVIPAQLSAPRVAAAFCDAC